MRFMDLPTGVRQIMAILSYFCLVSTVLLTAAPIGKRSKGDLPLAAACLVLSYCCIQIMCGVARRLAWALEPEGFAKWITELSAVLVLALFGAMVGLSVLLTLRTLRRAERKPAALRFSALKVRLHDTFGLSLVASKAYYDGQAIDRDTVHLLYSRCKECFGEEQLFSCRTYESIYQIGQLIGVELAVTGTLPEEETTKPVVCAALSECMLNTFRHAWGDRVTAEVSWEGQAQTITIRNNGRPPSGPIQERGGLKHLRSYAQSLGIAMTVASSPEFSLTLFIPQEVRYGL